MDRVEMLLRYLEMLLRCDYYNCSEAICRVQAALDKELNIDKLEEVEVTK